MPSSQPGSGVVLVGLTLAGVVGGATTWALAVFPALVLKPLAESNLKYWVVFPLTMFFVLFAVVAVVGAVLIGGLLYKLVVARIGISWPTSIALGAISGGATLYLVALSKGLDPFLLGAAAGVPAGIAFHLYVRSEMRSREARDGTA